MLCQYVLQNSSTKMVMGSKRYAGENIRDLIKQYFSVFYSKLVPISMPIIICNLVLISDWLNTNYQSLRILIDTAKLVIRSK